MTLKSSFKRGSINGRLWLSLGSLDRIGCQRGGQGVDLCARPEKAACLHGKEDFLEKRERCEAVSLVAQQKPMHSAGEDVSASDTASCPGQPHPHPLPCRPPHYSFM